MKRTLGLFLLILMSFAGMRGYTSQAPRHLPDDQLIGAMGRTKDPNAESIPPSDRDQTTSLRAFAQEMRKFLQQSPDSEFAPTVQQLLERVEETLAFGDFKVGQFYADRGNHVGARSRLKTLMDNYPNFSRIEEVKQLYEGLQHSQ